MKTGEVSVVEYDVVNHGFRVSPLQRVADLGRLQMERLERSDWVVVGFSADESRAVEQMKRLRGKG